jgi:hypothetical protein
VGVHIDKTRAEVLITIVHVPELVNVDGAFLFPIRPVQPYVGLGLAPVITSYEEEPASLNLGFNIFGGVLFPLGYSMTGMFELRGKLGRPYDVFKISAGILFEPHIYYHHHRREK